jgi:hypothetical protein
MKIILTTLRLIVLRASVGRERALLWHGEGEGKPGYFNNLSNSPWLMPCTASHISVRVDDRTVTTTLQCKSQLMHVIMHRAF